MNEEDSGAFVILFATINCHPVRLTGANIPALRPIHDIMPIVLLGLCPHAHYI